MSESIDRVDVRRGIREYIRDQDAAMKTLLLNEVAAELDVPHGAVVKEFEALEREGFLYCVPQEDATEVRVP